MAESTDTQKFGVLRNHLAECRRGAVEAVDNGSTDGGAFLVATFDTVASTFKAKHGVDLELEREND